jgi:hypothetical protein
MEGGIFLRGKGSKKNWFCLANFICTYAWKVFQKTINNFCKSLGGGELGGAAA